MVRMDRSMEKPAQIAENIAISAHPISHGVGPKDEAYDSTAFFFSSPSGHQFLFFGDVGPGTNASCFVTSMETDRNAHRLAKQESEECRDMEASS